MCNGAQCGLVSEVFCKHLFKMCIEYVCGKLFSNYYYSGQLSINNNNIQSLIHH